MSSEGAGSLQWGILLLERGLLKLFGPVTSASDQVSEQSLGYKEERLVVLVPYCERLQSEASESQTSHFPEGRLEAHLPFLLFFWPMLYLSLILLDGFVIISPSSLF